MLEVEGLKPRKVVIIGGGYVGLVSAVCLASIGHKVRLVELDSKKAEVIKSGKAPFFEAGLADVVSQLKGHENFTVFTNLASAMAFAPDVVFLCVGTPSNSDGSADLSQVWAAVDQFVSSVKTNCVFACKSTVPVGTTRKIDQKISTALKAAKSTAKVLTTFVPEFLREGSAIRDFLFPDRIVVGSDNVEAIKIIKSLHKPLLKAGAQFFDMSPESAELVKYTSNAMLATRISLINEVAALAEKVGADIESISPAVGADARIGPEFLSAGLGFGGSCLPKDLAALAEVGQSVGMPMTIAQKALSANDAAKQNFLDKIIKVYPNLSGKKIGLFGLSFKPGTDDLRHSPGLWLAEQLLALGADIVAYDPHCPADFVLTETFAGKFDGARKGVLGSDSGPLSGHGSFAMSENFEQLLSQDFLVITHKTSALEALKPERFLMLSDRRVFDGRNCFEANAMSAAKVDYVSVGRSVKNEQKKEEAEMASPIFLKSEDF